MPKNTPATDKAAKKPERISDLPSDKVAIMVFGTVADTTWRLFIPSIGGTLLGLWVDKSIDTVPIFTIIGIVTGTVLAIWLVYLQIKKTNI